MNSLWRWALPRPRRYPFTLHSGPVVEEGLLIGVSIAAMLILISIVMAILDNTANLFNELRQ